MRTLAAILWGVVIQSSVSAAEPLPAKLLDLSHWKLTLPTDTRRPGSVDEVWQPELGSFHDPKHFFANDSRDGVVFRAYCGGGTTKGSKYPRCELRELNIRGALAAWGTDDGATHAMTALLAITKTPPVRKHVVCAQIHGADDALLMVRLEGKELLIERESEDDVALDPDYVLGKRFELKLQAAHGQVNVWYNGVPKLNWKVSRTRCYFKAGCYPQSNTEKGDAPDSYGEVVIHRLLVEHRN
ncbi:polysaccharide lyase family 7 protein [Candidatus Sumerlaeota bacterium]|nr:polysaccharide lyase family 7 protein [Candidatus Sumerlaeota bacterium]